METPETNIRRMIQELNQYILPSTLMESFDAYREEGYKEAIRSIAPSSLAWYLDMLNRYRGPEDRKESLLEVFDPSMFTVNHPAWEKPTGTAIDLPALTSEIAGRAEKGSEMAEIAREEVREFREHTDTYDDAEFVELGRIAIAGLADSGRTFRDREDAIRYLALNASAKMEDLWATDDTAWIKAPARHVEFPDMVERRKEQLLAGKGTPRMREEELRCYSDDEVRSFALDMRSLFIHDRARHLAVCTRCQTRLESWTKLLSEFDRNTFTRHGRADA
jgi:hypothetical protein